MLTSLWEGFFKKFKYININCNHGNDNDIGNYHSLSPNDKLDVSFMLFHLNYIPIL